MKTSAEKLAYLRAWRRQNVDRVRANNEKYRALHRDEMNAADRAARRRMSPRELAAARERSRQWYANNRERSFFSSLQRKYGLSIGQWQAMLNEQRGRCASCRFVFTNDSKYTKPHVDHCHRTGKVRGLICSPCNLTLGTVGESIDRLQGLIRYLRRSA